MCEEYKLYGGEISYFTGKARAYLRFKNIPFRELVATRDVYKNVIMRRVGWPVIPVVVTPENETLQDTTDIIDALEKRFPQASVYPNTPRQRLVALLLEVYGDEWLKIPAMHYRWTKNRDWIIEEFGRLAQPDLPPDERRRAGEKASRPFAGALPALGATPNSASAIEKSYQDMLTELDTHFANHDYLFGTRPSIGDFGLIGPLYAHQYRDPASGELMRELAPHVARWVTRMLHPPEPNSGRFDAADTIQPTLMPILKRMMREYLPILDKTALAFAQFVENKPAIVRGEESLPRAIGMHDYELEGVIEQRAIFLFDLWMLQRPLDYFRKLSGAELDAVRDLLNETGGEALLNFPSYPRLTRRNFRLSLQ